MTQFPRPLPFPSLTTYHFLHLIWHQPDYIVTISSLHLIWKLKLVILRLEWWPSRRMTIAILQSAPSWSRRIMRMHGIPLLSILTKESKRVGSANTNNSTSILIPATFRMKQSTHIQATSIFSCFIGLITEARAKNPLVVLITLRHVVFKFSRFLAALLYAPTSSKCCFCWNENLGNSKSRVWKSKNRN